MRRSGFSMIELMATMWLLGVLLDIGVSVNAALLRSARTTTQSTMLVDLTCDSLRKDLMMQTRIQGVELVAGKVHWRVVAGFMTRNGVQRCHATADWSISGHQVDVRVHASGMPAREVRSWQ